MVKTYACRNAIRSSKNIIAVTITQGNAASKIIAEPEVNNVHENPIRILRSACPDIIFAKRRILRLKTRAI
jgi:hypothetical protein